MFLALACACATHPVPSPPATPVQFDPLAAALATIRADDLVTHVRTLASDSFEGRFPGTAGEAKTVAYISAAFGRLGLAPALDGSYLQPVPLLAATVVQDARLIARAGGKSITLRWGPEVLMASPTAAPRTALARLDAIFVGHGIVAPEYGWDDYKNRDVAGKLVLLVADEPRRDDDPKFFEGRALSRHGTRAHKDELAAERGAAAVLEIRGDEHGGVAWATLEIGARAPKYLLEHVAGKRPAISGIVREGPARQLLALGGHDLDALRAAALRPDFAPVPIAVVGDILVETSRQSITSHNVVGLLPGRTRPHEYVIYTAHWDHVGVRPSLAGDNIFNGAVDNATGTAALLELAEAFTTLRPGPERTVVFLATTAEEQGLLGARHYAEHPLLPLRDTAGVINMDALFPFGATKGMTVVGLGSSELEPLMDAAARAVGRKLYADPNPEFGAFFRSDHYPFAEKGVPAIFAVGGPALDPAAGDVVDLSRYEDYVTTRYHQPGDHYDPATWDMGGILQDVVVYFRTGEALANSAQFPNWNPGHPFRAKRDAMRGG